MKPAKPQPELPQSNQLRKVVLGGLVINGWHKCSLIGRTVLAGVVLLVACWPGNASAQTNAFQWAKRVASTVHPDDEFSIGMALDSSNNVYVTGWFDGTNDFGGVLLTNSTGGGQDIFVAKYNSAGALQWARRAGGNSVELDGGRGLGVDSAGNVYVTGQFSGTADFGGFTLTATNDNQEFFLAKYNSAGTIQWARQSTGGNGYGITGWNDGVYGTGIAVDGAGNSYCVGFAANVTTNGLPVDFDGVPLLNTNDDGGQQRPRWRAMT